MTNSNTKNIDAYNCQMYKLIIQFSV